MTNKRQLTIISTLLLIASVAPVTAGTAHSLYTDCSGVMIPEIKRNSDEFKGSSRCVNFLWAVAKRMNKAPDFDRSRRLSAQERKLMEYVKKQGSTRVCPLRSPKVERALVVTFLRYWDAKGLGVIGQWTTSDTEAAEGAFMSMENCVE